jgi:hypothetical protein
MPLDQSDLEAIRQLIRAELAPIHNRLAVLEQQFATLQHLEFLRTNDMAREVVIALRKHTTPQTFHENIAVPPDTPRRPNIDRVL